MDTSDPILCELFPEDQLKLVSDKLSKSIRAFCHHMHMIIKSPFLAREVSRCINKRGFFQPKHFERWHLADQMFQPRLHDSIQHGESQLAFVFPA